MQQHIAPYTKKYLKARSKEVNSIQNEINRIFDKHIAPIENFGQIDTLLEPDIEISETAKKVQVTAELPGMNANDINLHISKDGYLTISGEKTNTHEQQDDEGFYFSERSYGFINRTIELPSDIDEENVSASFEKGLLKITIPKLKSEKQNPKKIQIKEK
ncbi:MAG: Hsp20/alpha crystallin family protein [Alphaproteobacteria bacterium]|nr:Hsp20/alpha crystallin family protein [Alphaproteobacteria bacterium]